MAVAGNSRYATICAMGKKNTTKKHKFKHVETGAGARAPEVSNAGSSARDIKSAEISQSGRSAAAGVPARDFSYVGTDLRRIGVMAVALVALEMALYYVLVYTPVGAAIYNLVKV